MQMVCFPMQRLTLILIDLVYHVRAMKFKETFQDENVKYINVSYFDLIECSTN